LTQVYRSAGITGVCHHNQHEIPHSSSRCYGELLKFLSRNKNNSPTRLEGTKVNAGKDWEIHWFSALWHLSFHCLLLHLNLPKETLIYITGTPSQPRWRQQRNANHTWFRGLGKYCFFLIFTVGCCRAFAFGLWKYSSHTPWNAGMEVWGWWVSLHRKLQGKCRNLKFLALGVQILLMGPKLLHGKSNLAKGQRADCLGNPRSGIRVYITASCFQKNAWLTLQGIVLWGTGGWAVKTGVVDTSSSLRKCEARQWEQSDPPGSVGKFGSRAGLTGLGNPGCSWEKADFCISRQVGPQWLASY
jgi:hypothetical protein